MTHKDQLQELLREVTYLKDRQAILDVVMRLSRGHDRHDEALMNSCFWEDGADEHGAAVTPGPVYGNTANGWHTGGFLAHNHNITTHSCEIDGDTAHCESYVLGTMLLRRAPGRVKITAGRYVDRLEKRDGEWRIVVRRTVIDEEIEGATTWPENEHSAGFPKGAWDEADVSYVRPLALNSPSPRWDDTTR